MVKLLLFQHQYFNMILKVSNIIIADHVMMTTIMDSVIAIVISMLNHVIMTTIIIESVIGIVISMSAQSACLRAPPHLLL